MRLNFYICTVQSLKYMLFNQFGHNFVVGLNFNRFDAVSAYMRKMDHYGLSDFLKISHIR